MKFPAFYRTQGFISFLSCLQMVHVLSQMNPVHEPRHNIPLRSVLILSSRLCLDLPSGTFASGLPTETLFTHLFHAGYMPSTTQPP